MSWDGLVARTALIITVFILGTLAGCGGQSATAPTPPDAPAATDTAMDTIALDVSAALDRAVPDDALGLDVPADQVVAVDATTDVNACAMGMTRCGDTCVDTTTNVTNCGVCGTNCRNLAGVDIDRVTCAHGACVLDGACLAGRGDCDGMTTTGCETDLTAATNCGRCGVTCSGPTPVCAMMPGDAGGTRACTSGCTPMTPTRCGSSCVDTTSDLMHCGGCGQACVAPAGGRAVCVAGVCTLTCGTGTHLCDGRCVADNDPNTCGSRCTPCPSGPVGSSPVCMSGACDFACGMGLHRCGVSCIAATSTSGCGTSCSPCPTATNADPTCDGTRCGFSCRAGFADCDHDPSNGCEASLVSPATCNRCDNRCTPPANATATCDGTSCAFTCNTGFHRCGASCLSNTSPASCGSSCSPCSAPDHATATCDGRSCDFVCDTGFTRCGSACVDSRTDVLNCGGCGVRCSTSHATVTCSAGRCVTGTCQSGYGDCNSDPSDGCESDLWSSYTCGSCGTACPRGYLCNRGSCVEASTVCGVYHSGVPCSIDYCPDRSSCLGRSCYCPSGSTLESCSGESCSTVTCRYYEIWCRPVP